MAKIELPKYLFRKTKPREELTREEHVKMSRTPVAAGKGTPPKTQIPAAFQKREKTMILEDKRVSRIAPPNWVKTHIARHDKVETVITQLFTRMDRIRGLRTIVETKNALNEIGRMKDGGKLIRKTLTQELVNKYLEKEEK